MLERKDIAYEKAVLVGVVNQQQPEEKVREYLDELEFLTYTAGGEVVKRYVQRVDTPNPKTFIGSGKLKEVEAFVKQHDGASITGTSDLALADNSRNAI